MGCGCGKSFSQPYATGSRRTLHTSHVPNQRPPAQQITVQSKSLQARNSATVQTSVNSATTGRRKV